MSLRATSNGEEPAPSHPTVLLVDDNRDLLQFLERLMAESGWELMAAESASEARKMVAKRKPNAALLDYMLPDGNGVELAQQLKQIVPNLQIIMMTGSMLPPEEEAICEEHEFPVLAQTVSRGGCDESDPQPAGGRERPAAGKRQPDLTIAYHHATMVVRGGAVW